MCDILYVACTTQWRQTVVSNLGKKVRFWKEKTGLKGMEVNKKHKEHSSSYISWQSNSRELHLKEGGEESKNNEIREGGAGLWKRE